MAEQHHLAMLKQGIVLWNLWRGKHPSIQPDLSGADLSGTDLSEADLIKADLSKANLSGADLSKADLSGANLSKAILSGANLFSTDLIAANLYGANLGGAYLIESDLTQANFSLSEVGGTSFDNVDLHSAKGLDTMIHWGPSTIGIDTIYRSEGHIPDVFLRGAGVPDTFIDYMHSLVFKPIDYYTCFISYSSKDEAFAKRLYADLQSNSVRCWFAPEHMKIGDKIRVRIDESIRQYDKLLLVLSEHSVSSLWVEREVETAFEKERQRHKEVLFPIRVDETVIQTTEAWAADIRRTRHIGNFTKWKHHDDYQQAFARLLRDLQAGT